MAFGLYGKHPAFGDFIAQGLTDDLRLRLEGWTAATMAVLSEAWGEGWRDRFDGSPSLGLWLGAGAGGAAAFLGAVMPSRDKVGRRFPLVLGWEGAILPPVLAPAAAAAVLPALATAMQTAQATAGDARGFGAALSAAAGDPPPQAAQAAYWAARQDDDLERLFTDSRPEEELRGGAGRSCLWRDAPRACLHAAAGLPDPAVFLWMLSGAALAEQAEGEVA